MALSAVKDKLDRVMDKNMQDLVRGIRKHKNDESKYINECMEEIKNELKQGSFCVKANAVSKLIYLQMLGYDISWSVFNIVEVMSSPKFTYKRIGYLAASQSFHAGTDVLMLATNLIRKDLSSALMYDTGIALSGLACFMTPDLASDLHNDILSLMNSPKPYLRKKSVLLLYKIFLNYPEALRICFPRLRDKLEDPDPGVQSAAVNVICELARQNPKNYLSLSPIFFKLMTSSTNNWVLIKIIKLFGTLTTLEPRLGKKILEPLTNLIHSTSATSLLYECINTLVAVLISISAGAVNYQSAIQLCILKLRILIEDSDQNLKYLGLLAMRKFLSYYPTSVQPHKDLILGCLDDKDESIRLRALDLLHGMISKTNLVEIVKHVVQHIANATSGGMHYRNELVTKVVQICSQDHYQYVTSFEWYISVLLEIGRMDGIRNGELLASQLMDVAIRVPTVRQFCVEQMSILLAASPTLLTNSKHNAMKEIVCAAAWICGEYAVYLPNPRETLIAILDICYQFNDLPGSIQSVLIMNSLKLCRVQIHQWTLETNEKLDGHLDQDETHELVENVKHQIQPKDLSSHDQIVENLIDKILDLCHILVDKYTLFVHSSDLEVQERAVSTHQLLCVVVKRLDKFKIALHDQTPLLDGAKISSHNHSPLRPSPVIPPYTTMSNPIQPDQNLASADFKSPNQQSPPDLPTNSFGAANRSHDPVRDSNETTADDLEFEQLPNRPQTSALSANIVLGLVNRLVKELVGLFPGEMNPVAPKAQLKVPIPADLDLDAWINPPIAPRKAPLDFNSLNQDSSTGLGIPMDQTVHGGDASDEHTIFPNLSNHKPSVQLTAEQLEEIRLKRLKEQENNPHYLKGPNLTVSSSSDTLVTQLSPKQSPSSLSPYQSLDLDHSKPMPTNKIVKSHNDNFLDIGLAKSDDFAWQAQNQSTPVDPINLTKKSKSNKLKKSQSTRDPVRINGFPHDPDTNSLDQSATLCSGPVTHLVRSEFDMPEGMTMDAADSSSEDRDVNDPHRKLNIVLDDLLPQPSLPMKSKKSRRKLVNHESTNSTQPSPCKSESQSTGTISQSKSTPQALTPTNSPQIETNNFLHPTPIGTEEFAQLLINGNLSCCQSTKFKSKLHNSDPRTNQFTHLLNCLSNSIPCSIVESIDSRAASLFATDSRSKQPICSLMKLSNQTGSIVLSVRSTNSDLVAHFLCRFKAVIKHFNDID